MNKDGSFRWGRACTRLVTWTEHHGIRYRNGEVLSDRQFRSDFDCIWIIFDPPVLFSAPTQLLFDEGIFTSFSQLASRLHGLRVTATDGWMNDLTEWERNGTGLID